MDDNDRTKRLALTLAVRFVGEGGLYALVLQTADEFAQWLGSPVVKLVIKPDTITYYQDGRVRPVATLITGGKVELKDNQQVLLSLHAKDAKGFDTTEAEGTVLTWSSSDDSVLGLQPAADGMTCLAVAGNPGAALANVTDGTRSGSLAFDVTAGDVSAITVEAGTPEDQPPAP